MMLLLAAFGFECRYGNQKQKHCALLLRCRAVSQLVCRNCGSVSQRCICSIDFYVWRGIGGGGAAGERIFLKTDAVNWKRSHNDDSFISFRDDLFCLAGPSSRSTNANLTFALCFVRERAHRIAHLSSKTSDPSEKKIPRQFHKASLAQQRFVQWKQLQEARGKEGQTAQQQQQEASISSDSLLLLPAALRSLQRNPRIFSYPTTSRILESLLP
jgi:hypothetical protein